MQRISFLSLHTPCSGIHTERGKNQANKIMCNFVGNVATTAIVYHQTNDDENVCSIDKKDRYVRVCNLKTSQGFHLAVIGSGEQRANVHTTTIAIIVQKMNE